MMLHCPMFATNWSTNCSRDGTESKSWPSKQVKCSSTGRSTAIKRKQRKKPIGQLSSTALPLFSSNVFIIRLICSRTKYRIMASNPSRAVGKHPSQSKSSVILLPPLLPTAFFSLWVPFVCDTFTLNRAYSSTKNSIGLVREGKSSLNAE